MWRPCNAALEVEKRREIDRPSVKVFQICELLPWKLPSERERVGAVSDTVSHVDT